MANQFLCTFCGNDDVNFDRDGVQLGAEDESFWVVVNGETAYDQNGEYAKSVRFCGGGCLAAWIDNGCEPAKGGKS